MFPSDGGGVDVCLLLRTFRASGGLHPESGTGLLAEGVGEGRAKDREENDRVQLISENETPLNGGWRVCDLLGRPSPPTASAALPRDGLARRLC